MVWEADVRLVVATVEACGGNNKERVLVAEGRVYDEEEGVYNGYS